MIYRYITCSLLVFFALNVQAQSSFSASPTLVEASKPVTNFVFYNYTQFENHTDDTLYMRWVRMEYEVFTPTGISMGQDFGDWDIAVQDPNTFHNPANMLDSFDFFLPPVTGSTDKFILQLFPSGQAGELLATYAFFPINDPSDVLLIDFVYTATEVTTAVNSASLSIGASVYPNPASDRIFLECTDCLADGVVSIISPDGKRVLTGEAGTLPSSGLDVGELPPGLWYLQFRTSEGFLRQLPFIKL